jgi:tRNA pseudouridine55 synthase
MARSTVHGLLVLDKPSGITSREAVDRAQRWFPRGTRIGHTGTLDPLATGVLVLCLGVATRLTEYVQAMRKTYRAVFVLGERSDTDDADGTIVPVAGVRAPARDEIERCVAGFVGVIDQVPPAYSAAKVTGRRAYDLARRGQEVSLAPRPVHIYEIDILGFDYPRLEVEVRCGKGTYIRSLARDLGDRLGCGAYVAVLRRTRVGPFDAVQAIGLDAGAATARARLLPVAAAVSDLSPLVLADADARRLRQGQVVPLGRDRLLAAGQEVAVFGETGDLIAVAKVLPDRAAMGPVKVLGDGSPRGSS